MEVFVGVVLLDKNQRIFLIKEEDKNRIAKGRWNLPGGSVDNGEGLVEAATRETLEETGYKAKVERLIGCYLCRKGRAEWIYAVFSAKSVSRSSKITDAGVKVGKWFNKDEFIKLKSKELVHPDMKLVYEIAIGKKGLSVESVKFIDYSNQ